MSKLMQLAILNLLLMSMVFGGTIGGRVVFSCPEPAGGFGGATILTEGQMAQLITGAIEITEVPMDTLMSPPWVYEVEGTFSDDTGYFAFAVIVVDMVALKGNPMGIYQDSPFNTTGGSAEGIEIMVDDTIDLELLIHPGDVEFTDIYALVCDLSNSIMSGVVELDTEMTVLVSDTFCIIPNVPSGLKQILIFKDENENAIYDEGETNAYVRTMDTTYVFAVIGNPFMGECYLEGDFVNEKRPAIREIDISLYPSPFNSELAISIDAPAGNYSLEICDIAGKQITSFDVSGGDRMKWRPDGLQSGVYFVRLIGNGYVVEKKAIYMK